MFAVAVDDTHIYFAVDLWGDLGWLTRQHVYRIPKSGGAPELVVDDDLAGRRSYRGAGPSSLHRVLAVDDTHLYWGAGSAVKRMKK